MPAEKLDGLACLAYIANSRGIGCSLSGLVRRYGQIKVGPRSDSLIPIAHEIGLFGKSLEVSWHDLPRMRKLFPALLPLMDGSVVVLESLQQDPGAGWVATLVAPAEDDVAEHSKVLVGERQLTGAWEGRLILLKRKYRLDDESRPFGTAWVVAQVLRERALFRDISIASLFSTAFAIAPAFITMIVVDRVIVNHSVSTLWVIVDVLLGLILFEMVLGFLRRLFVQVTATRIDGRLNLYIIDRVLKLPLDYFERTPTGYTLGQLRANR